jgi:hypothetical protein
MEDYSHLFSIRGDLPLFVIPEPGQGLSDFLNRLAGIGDGLVDLGEVGSIRSQLASESLDWPHSLLVGFKPPRIRVAEPLPCSKTKPADHLICLGAAFAETILGLSVSEIQNLPSFSASTDRWIRERRQTGRSLWTRLGAWPWVNVGAQQLPKDDWWSGHSVQLSLTRWFLETGLENVMLSGQVPLQERERAANHLRSGYYSSDAVEAREQRAEEERRRTLTSSGQEGVPERFRQPYALRVGYPSYTAAAQCIFVELVRQLNRLGD